MNDRFDAPKERRKEDKHKDRHHKSKEADAMPPVHQKRHDKEQQNLPNLKSPEQGPSKNPNQSKEAPKQKNMLGTTNNPKINPIVNSRVTTVQTSPATISIPNKVAPAAAGSSLSNPPAPAVELPSYYNPAAINVAKYTTQIQKRKLLWSNKKAESVDQNVAKWQQTAQFAKDEDGKVASKFMRLMGIKNAAPADKVESDDGRKPNDFAKKQADMFSSMEQQYEVARQATHTMRGMGLGFSRQF